MDRRHGRRDKFMKPRDRRLAQELNRGLALFHRRHHPLPGIQVPQNREAFIEQVLESIHRVRYISVISNRDISPLRSDPSSEFFDPIKSAIFQMRAGETDEAFWLVFLSV